MKTLKEFDYDLWAIEENGRKRYFARIKATGEETEVSLEVMRLLLRQEKQMRREYAKQQTIGPVPSLDAFCKTLTDSRRSIFLECLNEGKSQSAYAAEHGMTRQSVHDAIALIRKKSKNIFCVIPDKGQKNVH